MILSVTIFAYYDVKLSESFSRYISIFCNIYQSYSWLLHFNSASIIPICFLSFGLRSLSSVMSSVDHGTERGGGFR